MGLWVRVMQIYIYILHIHKYMSGRERSMTSFCSCCLVLIPILHLQCFLACPCGYSAVFSFWLSFQRLFCTDEYIHVRFLIFLFFLTWSLHALHAFFFSHLTVYFWNHSTLVHKYFLNFLTKAAYESMV